MKKLSKEDIVVVKNVVVENVDAFDFRKGKWIDREDCIKLSRLKEVVEDLKQDISGHYPKDVFKPVSQKELDKINTLLLRELGFPLDRLSAMIMRIKERIDMDAINERFSSAWKKEEK